MDFLLSKMLSEGQIHLKRKQTRGDVKNRKAGYWATQDKRRKKGK